MSRYFDMVKSARNDKEGWLKSNELKAKYSALKHYWDYNSPSYDDILEIIDFVRMLKSAYFYPNRFGDSYAVIDDKNYRCPLVIDISENTYSVEFKAGYIFGVYNSRYIIKITLTTVKDIKWMEISIRETEGKKVISKIKFEDGKYRMKGEEFEEELFITVISNLYESTRELVDVYSGRIQCKDSLDIRDYLLPNNEHKDDEKGLIQRSFSFLKNLLP